jgi:hypothetical protein
MHVQLRRVETAVALVVALIAGCASSGEVVTAAPLPLRSGSATPLATPSNAATPTPSSEALSDPSAVTDSRETPFDWYPWLPVADPTVVPSLAMDSFVRTASLLPVSAEPGGPPYRFDTGDPDPSTHPLMGVNAGTLLTVLRGPVIVDNVEWYLFAPAQLATDVPTGWSPLSGPDGNPLVKAAEVPCPGSPMTSARLWKLQLTDGLPACYGATVITISGRLKCSREPDSFATGADWLAAGSCHFDGAPTVFGLDPELPPGRYAVTGSFLHPAAAACRPMDGGENAVDRLSAVLHCRRGFVAIGAQPS